MEYFVVDFNEEVYWNILDFEDDDEQQGFVDDKLQVGSEILIVLKLFVDYLFDEEVEDNNEVIVLGVLIEEIMVKVDDVDD